MIFTLLISGMIWAQTMPWQDTEFPCLDQNTAQKYVRDFNVDTQAFGGVELCKSQVDSKKLFNDLSIIEKGSFQAGENDTFIRGFVPADNYYSWMKSQTRGMDRGSDMPTATAYNSGGYFTMQDGWALLSTLGRVGTVIHEARHTSGYGHTQCTQGPYQDVRTAGCDRSYSYGGSHGVEMEYYARVSKLGTNFHPVYKTMARLMAIARSNFVFNEPVIQKKEAMLALSAEEGRADLFLDGKIYPREAPTIEGRLKRTSAGAVVFDGLHAKTIELYGTDVLNVSIDDTYSYYKLIKEKNQPLVDFEEFDVGAKRFVVQSANAQTMQFYDFANGGWGRPISTNIKVVAMATRLENNQTGLFLIDDSANIYPVNPQSKSVGRALDFKWNPELISVATLGNYTYVLKTDGQIYQQGPNDQLRPVGTGRGLYRGMINTPVYNGFEVQP